MMARTMISTARFAPLNGRVGRMRPTFVPVESSAVGREKHAAEARRILQ
jgi:hypothetical protein